MSSGINHVTLFGNLGASPELRFSSLGAPILKMRVATNDAYYDKEKNLVERTDWHDVVMFGTRAEPLSRLLNKGDSIVVEGSIRYSSYEKEGVTRYRTEIVAKDLCLASRRKAAGPSVAQALPEDPYPSEVPQATGSSAEAVSAEAAVQASPIVDVTHEAVLLSDGSKKRRGRFDSNGATARTEEVTF